MTSAYLRRKERAERDRVNSELCAECGYARINVVHEQNPDNAPEGKAYYDAMRDRLHPFVPSGRWSK